MKIIAPVSILIPSRFNNRWILDLNLRTIRKYTTDCPYKIIVGDAGIEQETLDFLSRQQDVEIVKCPDPIRPKDHLARIIRTPYLVFLHDDVQILKDGWLGRRVKQLESHPLIGLVGETSHNYLTGWRWRRFITLSPTKRRFFPLGLLVRKEMQDELDLFWGIIKGFDTGGIAYLQFRKQKKWRFRHYPFKEDIKHWAQMTWVMKKRERTSLNVEKLQAERNEKIEVIKNIITSGSY